MNSNIRISLINNIVEQEKGLENIRSILIESLETDKAMKQNKVLDLKKEYDTMRK